MYSFLNSISFHVHLTVNIKSKNLRSEITFPYINEVRRQKCVLLQQALWNTYLQKPIKGALEFICIKVSVCNINEHSFTIPNVIWKYIHFFLSNDHIVLSKCKAIVMFFFGLRPCAGRFCCYWVKKKHIHKISENHWLKKSVKFYFFQKTLAPSYNDSK